MGKLATARAVLAPYRAPAGTSTGPRASRSVRGSAMGTQGPARPQSGIFPVRMSLNITQSPIRE